MTLSHQNARLKLRLPDGVKARLDKVQGALKVIKRAGGREADVELGDLRFGDRRGRLTTANNCPLSANASRCPCPAFHRNRCHEYRRVTSVI